MRAHRIAIFLWITRALMAASGLDWVDGLGGRVDRDAGGDIIAVHLRVSWVSDTELLGLARLPICVRLDLSLTGVTDEVLLPSTSALQIKHLNLNYADHVTDQGIVAIP